MRFGDASRLPNDTSRISNQSVVSADHEVENWGQAHECVHEDRLSEMRPREILDRLGARAKPDASGRWPAMTGQPANSLALEVRGSRSQDCQNR